ncbi:cupin [Salinicola avicenniae]|uniref:cupin n=1 Tax=Salinicola avicenniae TaxID=2916836 RepID=UPI002072DEA0|nr:MULTISPECIES: cupin [unclassified Salinicola]
MSFLNVYHEADGEQPLLTTRDPERIGLELAAEGIHFQRYDLAPLLPSAAADQVLDRHAGLIDEVSRLSGCQRVELRGMSPVFPDGELRRELLFSESRGADDVWHLFLHGQAIFYLHLGGRVYVIGCERGDLISVPAKMPHWFDMGPQPDFVTLSLSRGVVSPPLETASDIASRFPRFERLVDGAAA